MKIPIFPLNGAVMFPKTNLPLNIFEKRYIDMIDFSLSNKRIIGMIQSKPNSGLYNIGCYGKITSFNETPDKRYLINLEGVCFYKIIEEIITDYKFRMCKVEIFDKYENVELKDNLKTQVLDTFKRYNIYKNINLSIDEISRLNLTDLLKFIVMVSPFDVTTKQMFLELKSNQELLESVISVLEIELASIEKEKILN